MARRNVLAPASRPALLDEEADLSAAAIDAFATAIGGTDELLQTLAVADGTREASTVVRLLLDPRYAGWPLRRICALAGLTVADLFIAYKKSMVIRAHLEATRVVADHLVEVVRDVMVRARPVEITCSTCQGTTAYTPEPTKKVPNPEPIPCPACRATGRLLQLPDLDRQKVALELGQLLKREGMLIQQNNLTVPAGGSVGAPGALEQLQQAVQEVLYPRAAPAAPEVAPPPEVSVEGEVVESPDGPPA